MTDDPRQCHFRNGTPDDLRKLEWFGEYTEHRQFIEQAFAAQAERRGLVLVAAVNRFPVAQLWVRFEPAGAPPRLWAFRVMRPFQNRGIGSGLLRFAEHRLRRDGFASCEIGVEKNNPNGRRFYQNRGYKPAYEQIETFSYASPTGAQRTGAVDQWILRKRLECCDRSDGESRRSQADPIVKLRS